MNWVMVGFRLYAIKLHNNLFESNCKKTSKYDLDLDNLIIVYNENICFQIFCF